LCITVANTRPQPDGYAFFWENAVMPTPEPAMQRPAPANLPPLSPAAQAHSDAAAAQLRAAITANGGWLPFDHWMAQALYAPGLGYYAAGNVKLADGEDDAKAPAGDFVTAPQLTPLFARTVARQVAQVLRQTQTQAVLEFGAGTGALAEGVLRELDAQGLDQTQYLILEVSADLRARQAERLAAFGDRVQWLDALPNAFAGCVLANEVLDAMPVSLFCWSQDGAVMERGVALDAQQHFVWSDRPASPALAEAVAARMPALPGYVSEINLQGEAWVAAMGNTSQARFLMNAGLMDLLGQLDPSDVQQYAQAVAPVQKLLSEAEMGELFKVLAVGRGITEPLTGFSRGDRLGKL